MIRSVLFTLLLHQAMAMTPEYCGVPLKDRRIVGGEVATDYEFPWQVPLFGLPQELPGVQDFFCGGTLISDQTVLTAGHCVSRAVEYDQPIYVGFPNGSINRTAGIRIASSKVTIHPYYDHFDYQNSAINDFAVITLSEPILFDEGVLPICLPDPNENYENKVATASGWGLTDGAGGFVIPEELRVVNMTVISNEECTEIIEILSEAEGQAGGPIWEIKSSMICAMSEGVPAGSPCNGDSGGPLITLEQDDQFYTQVGVVSWGDVSCKPGEPAVFARITNQLYWILSEMKGETLPTPVTRPDSTD